MFPYYLNKWECYNDVNNINLIYPSACAHTFCLRIIKGRAVQKEFVSAEDIVVVLPI